MDLFKATERMMTMDDRSWLRHANPLSGWTRMMTCLPLLVLAIWSRAWIGAWALVPVTLALVWIWANPRVFPPPRRLDNWMSKGVLGERVFLNHRHEIAPHHRRAAVVLSGLSLPGAAIMVWGLWVFWWEGAVFGMILTALPKIWFVDRMVWVHDDWLRAGRAIPGLEKQDV
ncbi:hypothetical protein KX928_08875 [Roseobacter sp. YSTF-M11]|uniref:Uncharacterized protein n=1 Tax=Roseobacter insulae TaxID=2859783 RepID=A0A9X1FV45_9RHOB|nr:DUF6653 family protein [Roseobacter insulae]MBW4707897.1 hypothetical protein [Roseobacter insulae]